MTAAASPWQSATVVGITDETATAKTFRLRLPAPAGHLAGQHYIVRLTAPDGYTAARSYSVASAPDGTPDIELTVERLPDGEVSSFLHDEVVIGDELELRGPIGGWFVWRGDRPALLIGGGSGVVPLMAMLRLARQSGERDLVRLVVSVRTPDDLYYAGELPGPESTVVYTRVAPPGYPRPAARLSGGDLRAAIVGLSAPAPADLAVYICGSSAFADAATDAAVAIGARTDQVRVERFGPSG